MYYVEERNSEEKERGGADVTIKMARVTALLLLCSVLLLTFGSLLACSKCIELSLKFASHVMKTTHIIR